MRRIAAAAGILIAWLFSPPAWAQDGAVRWVHDPVIIEEDGSYYVFSSGHGVPVRRSKDLLHWELLGRVFQDDFPAWGKPNVPGARDVWAPDISQWNGQFHLYYSISTLGSQRSCIGLATNRTLDPKSPDFKWVDHGKVIESFPGKMDWNAIDPNLVLDAHGQPWLVWGSFWGGIKLTRIDASSGRPLSAEPKIYSLAARPPNGPIEGAFLIHKKDWYYLFASVDHCCRGVASNYKVVVGRSRQITGPYLDAIGEDLLHGGGTVVLAGRGTCRGPGHNGILLSQRGDFLVHHMYDAAARGISTMQIRPMLWSDGWPVVGEPLNGVPSSQPSTAGVLGVWKHSVSFRPEEYIKLLPGGEVFSAVPGPTWSLDGSALRIRWPEAGAPGGAWVDTCYLAPGGDCYFGRNQKGDVIRGER